MARTNDRTQMLIGMILDEVQSFLDRFSYHMENHDDRWTPPNNGECWDVASDDDLTKAHKIVQDMISREGTKNPRREAGMWFENIKEAGPAPPEPARCGECLFIRKDAKPRKPHGLTFCEECHHAQV